MPSLPIDGIFPHRSGIQNVWYTYLFAALFYPCRFYPYCMFIFFGNHWVTCRSLGHLGVLRCECARACGCVCSCCIPPACHCVFLGWVGSGCLGLHLFFVRSSLIQQKGKNETMPMSGFILMSRAAAHFFCSSLSVNFRFLEHETTTADFFWYSILSLNNNGPTQRAHFHFLFPEVSILGQGSKYNTL